MDDLQEFIKGKVIRNGSCPVCGAAADFVAEVSSAGPIVSKHCYCNGVLIGHEEEFRVEKSGRVNDVDVEWVSESNETPDEHLDEYLDLPKQILSHTGSMPLSELREVVIKQEGEIIGQEMMDRLLRNEEDILISYDE